MRKLATSGSRIPGWRVRAALATLLCAAGLGALPTPRAAAQSAPGLGNGSRVRITSPTLGLTAATGTIQEATAGSLLVQFENPRRSVRIERQAITAMDISVARHRKVLKGLGIGALVGGGAGAVLGLASGDDPPGTFLAFTAGEKALMLGAFFGASGAVVGLISGALIRSDVWRPAGEGSPAPVDVSVLPFTSERGTGLRVGVSLAVR